MNKNKILKCVIFQFTVLWQSPDLMSHKLKSIVIKQFDRIEKKIQAEMRLFLLL